MTRTHMSSRRHFLRTVASTAAATAAMPALSQTSLRGSHAPAGAADEVRGGQPQRPIKLCFMTFVCPEWKIDKIVAFAQEAHYDGVEVRVDEGHQHDISTGSSAAARESTRRLFHDAGVEVAAIATSVQFASPDAQTHKTQLETAKANLDLAAALGAPVVRIFAGGGLAALTPEAAAQVAAAFDEVGEYAQATGVCPILECGHDIIKGHVEAMEVVRRVQTANFGVLWNDSTIEQATLADLQPRLRHFHVHDEVLDPDNTNILSLAGQIKRAGYRGYVSLEIIHGKNLPEDLLKSVAARLTQQIAQG